MGNILIYFTGSSSTANAKELSAGGFIGYAGSVNFKCISCYTYTGITLNYPNLKGSSIKMSFFNFSDFAGNALSCTLKNCYGDGTHIPNTNEWGNVFNYNVFAPSGGTRTNCQTYLTVRGDRKQVISIMKSSGGESTNLFKFIKYDPSSNGYTPHTG